MSLSRREFLARSAAVAGALGVTGGLHPRLAERTRIL